MLSPRQSNTIWNPEEEPETNIEHGGDKSTKRLRNNSRQKGQVPTLQHPRLYLNQRQSIYSKLVQAGFLLLSLVVLQQVYLGLFLISTVEQSSPQDQIPSLHFSTPTGTHNAPTGLFVDDDEIWHIYFQSASAPDRATDCAGWGHAISHDLYTWTYQPIALQDYEFDICGGSVVIDRNNTSGLFPHQSNGVVALYTRHDPATGTRQQAIAYSVDGGHEFNKYPGNAVLQALEGTEDLRDPKVIWHEPTQRWVMTAAKATSTKVGIYTSPNLIEWVVASEFANQDLVVADTGFELASLVSIPRITTTGAENPNWPTVPGGKIQFFGDYILVTSSSRGSPLNGGSITRYFPGKFNGSHFEPIDHRTDRFIDFGLDNYGSQFFFGTPEAAPVVGIGLATNLGYTTSSSVGRGSIQTSTFTIPREGYLIHDPDEADLSYFSCPVGLDSLRDGTLANLSAQNLSDFSVFYNSSEAVLLEAQLEMQPPDDESVELNVDFIFRSSKSSGHILCTTVFKTWIANFGCDRSQASSNGSIENSFLNQMSAHRVRPLLPVHNPAVRRWIVQLILDRSILEVFLNNGVRSGTTRIFSELSIDTVGFQGSRMPTWATLSVNVQRLRSSQTVPRHL